MIDKCLMFQALCLFNLGFAKDLKYFSNFKPGPLNYGPESVVTDYVTMTNDPMSNLPNEFTICSSLFYFLCLISTSQLFFPLSLFSSHQGSYTINQAYYTCFMAN